MANSIQSMMGTGTPAAQAAAISGIVAGSTLAGTGTTQGTASPLSANSTPINAVTSNTAYILPASAQPGDEFEVYNIGAQSALIFPHVGGNIGTAAANASATVATNKSAKFIALTPTLWGAIVGA